MIRKKLAKSDGHILKRFICVMRLVAIFSSGCEKQDPANAAFSAPTESMVFIKGADFLMGSVDGMPNKRPVHNVFIKSFWIDKTDVTVVEFGKTCQSCRI